MANEATKAELNAIKINLEEQISTLNQQLQILRQNVATDDANNQIQVVRAKLEEQIDALNKQIAQLRRLTPPEPYTDEIGNLWVQLNDIFQQFNHGLALIRGRLDTLESQWGSLPGSNFLVKQKLEDQIEALAHQISITQVNIPETADLAKIELWRAKFQEQIDQINAQIAQLRQFQATDNYTAQIAVVRTKIEEQITAINQRINQLNQLIQTVIDTDIEDIDMTEIRNELQEYINNLLEDIDIIYAGVENGEFTVDITTPGDTWTGTVHNQKIDERSLIFLQIQNRDVVTRIPGRTTDFIITVEGVRSGYFDWEMESMAKVFSGTVRVAYMWGI